MAAWIAARRNPLHRLLPRTSTGADRSRRSQPVLNEMLAFGRSPGLLPKHFGRVPDPLGSYGCRKCGFPAARDTDSMPGRYGSPSRCWPRPLRTQSEGLRSKAPLASKPAERE